MNSNQKPRRFQPTRCCHLQAITKLLLGLYAFALLGSGSVFSQSWPRHVIDSQFRGADGVKLFDVNSDGRADIVTGWEESGLTRAYLAPEPQAVFEPWPAVTVGSSPSVEDALWLPATASRPIAVLSSCEGKEQSLRLHVGPNDQRDFLDPTAWQTNVVPRSKNLTRWMFASRFRAADRSSLIMLGSKNPHGMVALMNTAGPAEHWTIEKLADASWIMSLFAADIDGDGDEDIVYSDRKGAESGIYWLEHTNTPEPNWRRHLIGGLGLEIMFVVLANSELAQGKEPRDPQQIYAAVKPNRILRFTEGADPSAPWQSQEIRAPDPTITGTAKGIALADIDGDRQTDIVLSFESATPPKQGIVYLSPDENQTYHRHDISGADGIKFDLLELRDLDGDGDLDVISCEERHAGRGLGVIWYANPLVP